MKKFKSYVLFLLVFLFSHLVLLGMDAHADVVSRNGDFSAGGDQWNINPAIPSTWSPFVSGAANLHPPDSFNGEVIYQNLNVSGIGGKTFNFACNLTNVSAPPGNTIAIYVDYIDTETGSDALVSERLVNPSNATITTATPVNRNFIFPATARKLVKLRIVKEEYGEFVIDDIQFASTTTVTVGSVPQITSISVNSGNYGSPLTITGINFGSTQGKILIGASSGAAITSWSSTSIVATVVDPARSGRVVVVSDFTESNNNNSYTVTSANYTVDLMAQTVQVVKGQNAEFVMNVGLHNGFTTVAGINFSVNGLTAGTVYSFTPVPISRSGGVVLRIATGTMTPGTYNLTITSNEASSVDRVISCILTITTTNPASFVFNYSDGVNPSTPVLSLPVTGQKQLVVVPSALDSSSRSVSELVVSSSNPSVLGVYKNTMGYYDVYSLESGSANLVATAPDGVSASLPITITVPADQRIDISLLPDTVTNKNLTPIVLNTTFKFLAGQWYGAGINGMITLTDSTLAFNSNPPSYYYGGQFLVDNNQTQMGTYLFNGSISAVGGGTLYTRVTPLTIINDSTYAGLNVALRTLDSSIMPMMYEHFTAEFYDAAGVLQFSRTHFSYDMNPAAIALVGAIPPGNYKVKIIPMSSDILPQWYPNADSAADAQLITFTANVNDGPRYFFVRKAPDTTPPTIFEFTVPSSSSSLIVTGIVLNSYDVDVAGYCLTETNDAAGCTWQVSSPTQYVFSTSGAKTLYAFLKDSSGNISITDASSTKSLTITLQYPLTLAFAGTGGGQVNGAVSCVSGEVCSPVSIPETPAVSLVATPDTDSTFGSWSGCGSVSETTCNVTVNSAKTVTVYFNAAPPVKLLDGSASGFATLRLAYDAASADALHPSTIQVRSIILPDLPLSFDRPVGVTIKGGYDAMFSTPNAGISTIQGPVTFKGGPVTIEKLAVK